MQNASTDEIPVPMIRKLNECANLVYLLQEWEALYRQGSAGGSKTIRAHRRRVRETLSKIVDGNPDVVDRKPGQLPVTNHFQRALDLGGRNNLSAMCRAVERVSGLLTWEYGYSRVPKTLSKKYGYCEILGPQGPIRSDQMILGLVLFAPNTTYPQHSHDQIEESYISLAGAWSENDLAVFAPGSLILNKPGEEHRITTGQYDPCLLAYAWIGPHDRLSKPGMKFSRSQKRTEQGI